MKKVFYFMLVLLLLVSCTGCNKDTEEITVPEDVIDYSYNELFSMGVSSDGRNMYAVYKMAPYDNYAYDFIGTKYVVKYDFYAKQVDEQANAPIQSLDTAKIEVYDVGIGEVIAQWDVKKILNEIDKNYQLRMPPALWLIKNNEEYFSDFGNLQGENGEELEQSFYVNIFTGEGIIANQDAFETDAEHEKRLAVIRENNNFSDMDLLLATNIEKQNGTGSFSCYNDLASPDICQLEFRVTSLPEHNDKLYSMFPELKEYRKMEDYIVHFGLPGNSSYMDILSLFTENEQVTFDGVILDGRNAIDRQDHEIHNLEDFEQWYNLSTQNMKQDTMESTEETETTQK